MNRLTRSKLNSLRRSSSTPPPPPSSGGGGGGFLVKVGVVGALGAGVIYRDDIQEQLLGTGPNVNRSVYFIDFNKCKLKYSTAVRISKRGRRNKPNLPPIAKPPPLLLKLNRQSKSKMPHQLRKSL